MKILHSLPKLKLRLLFWSYFPHYSGNTNIPCTNNDYEHHGCAKLFLGESDECVVIYCECGICSEDNEATHYFKRVSGYFCIGCLNDNHPVQP